MKRINLLLAGSCLLMGLAACNNNGTDSASTGSNTNAVQDSNSVVNNPTPTTESVNTSNTNPGTGMPLSRQDSAFVMKAAMGGMMEVQSSTVAQQNATHPRVKAFADMMVADHTQANSELQTLVGSRGMTLPTALPADMQKHMDEMRNMKGKAFDKHYVTMMLNDHKKDIAEFEKQASSGNDAELKAWAQKTLPTLQKHRDSVTALSKVKM